MTGFASEWANGKYDGTFADLTGLGKFITSVTGETKADLPWLKLALFNGIPNRATGSLCLRYDNGVIAVTGVEGDYDSAPKADGSMLSIEEAAVLLQAVGGGICALLYSTPGSTPEKPHWRVLAPFDQVYLGLPDKLRDLRSRFLARINGVLGGVLASESFKLSQSYYFGNVAGKPPVQIKTIQGNPVNWLQGLDAGALYQNGRSSPVIRRAPQTAPVGLVENDDNQVLLAEAARRVQIFVHKHGIGTQPRGERARLLGAWLADMRTSAGEILSAERIVAIMQEVGGFGEIEADIINTRQNERGCELVQSAHERLAKLLDKGE
jgi:hypothetical protein